MATVWNPRRPLISFMTLVALLFCAAELLTRVLVPVSLSRQISVPHMFRDSEEVGYRLHRNITTNVRAWDGRRNIFQATYRTDNHGRRFVEIPNSSGRDRHFVVLGGSTVFGMGLEDRDTLTAFLGTETTRTMPYNYAGDGYGPQNALALIKLGVLQNEVPQEEGVTVFFFQALHQAGGHIQTLLGRFELLLDGWGETLPVYKIARGEKPVAVGRLRQYDPLKFYFFRFLQNFHVLNLLYPKVFPISPEELQLTAEFMVAMRDEVRIAKPKSRFVVALHPFSDAELAASMTNIMQKNGLEVLNLSTLVDKSRLQEFVAFNRYFPHPNGKLNKLLATTLVETLEIP